MNNSSNSLKNVHNQQQFITKLPLKSIPFLIAASLHETISTSHSLPDQPGAQVHVYCGPF